MLIIWNVNMDVEVFVVIAQSKAQIIRTTLCMVHSLLNIFIFICFTFFEVFFFLSVSSSLFLCAEKLLFYIHQCFAFSVLDECEVPFEAAHYFNGIHFFFRRWWVLNKAFLLLIYCHIFFIVFLLMIFLFHFYDSYMIISTYMCFAR